MSCYKYWGKIREIADALASYGDLEKYGDSALDNVDINEIIKLLDEVEVIAHDNTIDFDSAKHILDDEKMNSQMKKSEAIILSMTEYERENPSCLKASRKNRIAKGAGVKVMDVNRLINQLEQMQMMTKMMSGKAKLPDMSALQNMQRGGGMPGMSKHSGSKKQKPKKKKKKK